MNKKKGLLNSFKHKLFGGLVPEGNLGLMLIGYKNYVGGNWDQIGKLQFEFLIENNLKPDHCFLDIGCGALRGGVRFIDYLNTGNYLGLEKEKKLIEIGKRKVLKKKNLLEKKPEFIISDRFEFGGFSKKPDFSLSLSLFTHLNDKDIQVCLQNLGKFVNSSHVFFATFFEGESTKNPKISHSLDHFDYTREEMIAFGQDAGWKAEYIGDWDHPRGQKMMKFIAV